MILMNNIRSSTVFLLSYLIFSSLSLMAQDKTMITPGVTLQYYKNSNDQRFLQTILTYSKNRMELPLAGMEISFFKSGATRELISTVVTDNKGIARYELGNGIKLPVDGKGMWTFSSDFRGNDTIETGTSEISIKDVKLEMTLSGDSIKTVSLKANLTGNGQEKPVSGEVVKVYVPRMFSLLPIGEITLDDSGTGSLEFPSDLPGDKEGNLTIISKFEENPTFGNVEKQSVTKWGKPTDFSQPTAHRALWTKVAPRWMIIALTILLSGVWGHYLYAVISLIRIRIDARKKEIEEHRQ
jgi:hypothetical protein